MMSFPGPERSLQAAIASLPSSVCSFRSLPAPNGDLKGKLLGETGRLHEFDADRVRSSIPISSERVRAMPRSHDAQVQVGRSDHESRQGTGLFERAVTCGSRILMMTYSHSSLGTHIIYSSKLPCSLSNHKPISVQQHNCFHSLPVALMQGLASHTDLCHATITP